MVVAVVLLATAFLSLFTSCNKDFPNTLRTEYPNDTANVKSGSRKVLYLILDGVRGELLETLQPPTLTLLRRNAISSYYGLTDYQTNTLTNAAAWGNMMTGVDYLKHNIIDESFTGNNIVNYPSIFTKIKEVNSKLKTVSIATSVAFNTNLAAQAGKKLDVATDAEVKDAVINELKVNEVDLIVGQFHSADAAAAAGGYEATNAAYTQAITNLDGYLGNIMTQLRSRPNYAKEDWMVVIASNKGGATTVPGSSDLGAFGDNQRNSFVLFYNPRFLSQQFTKPDASSFPFVGYAPNLIGVGAGTTGKNLIVANNNNVANFGTSGNFTLMFKVRFNNEPGSYPPIMGTQTVFNNTTNGWVIFANSGEGWNFKVRNTNQLAANAARKIFDGLWHTIAIQISTEGSDRKMQAFQDGVVVGTKATFTANATSTIPFTLGNVDGSGQAINVLLRDVAVYNVAIPDAQIPSIMRKSGVTATDPYYANLQAYYPLNETQGTALADATGKTTGMTYQGQALYTEFSELSKNVSPPISTATYKASMNNVDIPVQIYQWLNIQPSSSWNLDGKPWKLLYTDVRNN